MSEKEKTIMKKIIDTFPKLPENEQYRFLGQVEGMAMANESKPDPPRKEQ